MIRTALASLFALALAGAAQAHSPVGGGSATISGGGDDMVITYSTGGAGGGRARGLHLPGGGGAGRRGRAGRRTGGRSRRRHLLAGRVGRRRSCHFGTSDACALAHALHKASGSVAPQPP